jgi:hypothetical protein
LRKLGNLGKLPPELRDHVYSFLLDGTKVQYTPETGFLREDSKATHSNHYNNWFGRAHTYDFDMSIMDVCTTLTAEAKQFLYWQNNFVLVRFTMPGFLKAISLWEVPIVTEEQVRRSTQSDKYPDFDHWSLLIELRWQRVLPFVYPEEGILGEGEFLMLLQDVPKLCEMLKFLCCSIVPHCVFVESRFCTRADETVRSFHAWKPPMLGCYE